MKAGCNEPVPFSQFKVSSNRLDDLVRRRDLGGWPHGGGDRAVLGVREFDRSFDSVCRNTTSVHDMVDMERSVFTRMIVRACARDLDIIVGHILPLFLQDRDDVGRRACGDPGGAGVTFTRM